MREIEIIELEKRVRNRFEADIAALRRVRELLHPQGDVNGSTVKIPTFDVSEEEAKSQEQPTTPTHHPELPIDAETTIESKVIGVIRKLEGKFTFSDVMDKLLQTYPNRRFVRNTISGIVYRQKDKAFRVVSAGRGRKRAFYEKIDLRP